MPPGGVAGAEAGVSWLSMKRRLRGKGSYGSATFLLHPEAQYDQLTLALSVPLIPLGVAMLL